jgi:esterase/lipase superfamily enzyme
MNAQIVTNRILAKKTAFTGDARRPYVEIPFFGNEVDPKGNHTLTVTGKNGASHGNYDKFLWVEHPNAASFLDEVLRDKNSDKPVLFVVHGYNNDFPDSVGKHLSFQALLESEAGFKGTLVSYTWPSRGGGHLYAKDRRLAFASRGHLHDFVEPLSDACAAAGRPLIAMTHSMGNFLMREAARDQRKAHGRPTRPWFQRLIMAGADVKYHIFDSKAGKATDDGGSALCDAAREIVVLYWAEDSVLKLAEGLPHPGREARRLGRVGPARPNCLPKSVTSKNMEGFLVKHGGYFTEKRAVQALAALLHVP